MYFMNSKYISFVHMNRPNKPVSLLYETAKLNFVFGVIIFPKSNAVQNELNTSVCLPQPQEPTAIGTQGLPTTTHFCEGY
jgi:hypothetical protein